MKMKYTIAALAATTLAANAAVVTVDNYLTEPNGDTAGAVGGFDVQSFTPNVAGLGVNDTVTANSPLPANVFLQSATFLRAVSGAETAGQIFVNVYEGAGNGGTFLGSSTNSIDINSAAGLDALTWNFANLQIDSTLEHAFVFSTTQTDDTAVEARLQVARDSGGAFEDSYTAGTADDNANNSSPSPFDARFSVTYDTVPEPSSTALLGLGGLAMILRRRK